MLRKRSGGPALPVKSTDPITDPITGTPEGGTTPPDEPFTAPMKPKSPFAALLGSNKGEKFGHIVRRIVSDDAFDAYPRLEAALKIDAQRTDYGTLLRALDESEDNAREAHKLYVNAVIERERVELESEAVLASMREEAHRELQLEKDQGLRSKQITDADVSATCAGKFPDEWQAQQRRKSEAKRSCEHLERFADLWKERIRTLQVMITTIRR